MSEKVKLTFNISLREKEAKAIRELAKVSGLPISQIFQHIVEKQSKEIANAIRWNKKRGFGEPHGPEGPRL